MAILLSGAEPFQIFIYFSSAAILFHGCKVLDYSREHYGEHLCEPTLHLGGGSRIDVICGFLHFLFRKAKLLEQFWKAVLWRTFVSNYSQTCLKQAVKG